MTLAEMTSLFAAMTDDDGRAVHLNPGDYAGRYGISMAEAEQIAKNAKSTEDFERIWQDQNWWTDTHND
jgi:Ethanolamine utilization protein EutJ (predicted chaperonin)